MLELSAIEKSFGGVQALRGVDLNVAGGEIVGLLGGNGAGKSTLMKIAAGAVLPDQGSVRIGGQSPDSPAAAIRLGVSLVRQELIQATDLDVGRNVMLGHEPHRFGIVNERELYLRAGQALSRVGGGIDLFARLSTLSPGQRQRVEIARALSLDARVLLLDEPTAALSEADAASLFALLRTLRDQGLGMVYISHRLREVLAITDRIVCLRDGRRIAELPTSDASLDQLVELLAGPVAPSATASHAELGKLLLSVRGRVAFDLHAGEILGLAGLVGAGRSSVLAALFGAKPSDLELVVDGHQLALRSPRDAIRLGFGYVPEERASQGLLLDMLVERNIALPSLSRFLLEDERAIARPYRERLGIRAEATPRQLSGGNQQKVVLAKWMAISPSVLLLDEPTRGLDVAAKREVHDLVRALAAEGKGIIVSSSEADEIAALCQRTLVLSQGKSRGELARHELNEQSILRLAT